MAKVKKKNVVLDAQGHPVSAEVPDIISTINESDIAGQTVARMQGLLSQLATRSEDYAQPVEQLFAKLDEYGVSLETTVEMYATLKQAYLTTIHVVDGVKEPSTLVINLFSLIVGNAIFFRQFNHIPADKLVDVVIIVTNIMFQLEAGNDDTGAATT